MSLKFYKEYLIGPKAYVRDSEDDPWVELFPDSDPNLCPSIECIDENEHEDLEEREYISTNVEFDTESATFSGLPSLEIKIETKKIPNKIENIEHVRHNNSKRGLF